MNSVGHCYLNGLSNDVGGFDDGDEEYNCGLGCYGWIQLLLLLLMRFSLGRGSCTTRFLKKIPSWFSGRSY